MNKYCKCGCGQKVKNGCVFIHGHNARQDGRWADDKNRYQREWARKKREKICAERSLKEAQIVEKRKQKGRFKAGIVPWNKGRTDLPEPWNKRLTKESDERIMNLSKAVSRSVKKLWKKPNYKGGNKKGIKFNLTEEQREQYSERLSGKGNPMYGMSGEKSPVWKGGISFLPYPPEFNNKLKYQIKKRDNFTCQLCGIKKYIGQAVHHIDYEKKNCSPANLITLCISCNVKVNQNRDFWKNYFMLLIKKGGTHDLPQIRYLKGAELKPSLNTGEALTRKGEGDPKQGSPKEIMEMGIDSELASQTEREGTHG